MRSKKFLGLPLDQLAGFLVIGIALGFRNWEWWQTGIFCLGLSLVMQLGDE